MPVMPRYGTTSRTPVSRRDPAQLVAPAPVQPPRPAPNRWDHASIDELLRDGRALLDAATVEVRRGKQLATRRVLEWLEGMPADTWQDRWLLSGDPQPPGWAPEEFAGVRRSQYFTGVGVLIILGVIRPSYPWLFGNRPQHIYDAYRRRHQADTFAEMERLAAQRTGAPTHSREALTILTRLVIYTGKDLRDLHFRDLTTYAAARTATGRYTTALAFAYDLLRAIGGLAGAPPTFRQASARGQLTVAEMVDRYPIGYRPMRDVLVHYLAERAPALDYNSLATLSQILSEHFWVDLERHHPGIDTLRLAPGVVHAWKQRIRVLPNGGRGCITRPCCWPCGRSTSTCSIGRWSNPSCGPSGPRRARSAKLTCGAPSRRNAAVRPACTSAPAPSPRCCPAWSPSPMASSTGPAASSPPPARPCPAKSSLWTALAFCAPASPPSTGSPPRYSCARSSHPGRGSTPP
jgi:hypothetical protein